MPKGHFYVPLMVPLWNGSGTRVGPIILIITRVSSAARVLLETFLSCLHT